MRLDDIKINLESENPQFRMSAITALRQYEAAVAVPLLANRVNDPELIIRSFVAIGLGHKRTPEAFDILVKILNDEKDANVRSEAANALSRYGKPALSHLMRAFDDNNHWLIQLSILPAVAELGCPEALYTLCEKALESLDPVVQTAGLEHLGYLKDSSKHDAALEALLVWAESDDWVLRRQVALTISAFEERYAKNALTRLRQDADHRVVAATLESLLAR